MTALANPPVLSSSQKAEGENGPQFQLISPKLVIVQGAGAVGCVLIGIRFGAGITAPSILRATH